MILDYHQITIRDDVDDVDLSFGTWQAIFANILGMKRVVAWIILKLINFKQKQRHTDIVQQMLTTFNDDPDLLKKQICSLKPKPNLLSGSAQKR